MEYVSRKAVANAMATTIATLIAADECSSTRYRRKRADARTWYVIKYGWVMRNMTTGTPLSTQSPVGSVYEAPRMS